MSSEERVVVTGAGMMTAVGHDSVSASAAIRAGIRRCQELEGFVTAQGHRANGSALLGISDGKFGDDRLLALAIPALQEALHAAGEFRGPLDLRECRLLLALSPEERPAHGRFGPGALQALLDAAQAQPLLPTAEILRDGHTGGMSALVRACELLRSGSAVSCLVGGVDSLLDYKTLCWLDRAKRLKTEVRGEGFVPGEAAAFVVLELESRARERGAQPLASVLGVAIATESASIASGAPLRGKGLELAIRTALESCAAAPAEIAGIVCDLNGEYYRMKEWSLAASRLFRDWDRVPRLQHPAECIGDVGAATSPLLAGVVSTWLSLGFLGDSKLLSFSGSDAGTRASAVFARNEAA